MVVEAEDAGDSIRGWTACRPTRTADCVQLAARTDAAHIGRHRGTTATDHRRQRRLHHRWPFRVEAASETWHVGFDRGRDADTTLSELDRDNESTWLSGRRRRSPRRTSCERRRGDGLVDGVATSRHRTRTLETAVSEGYFEHPGTRHWGRWPRTSACPNPPSRRTSGAASAR